MAEKATTGARPAGRPVSSRRSGRVEEKLQQKIRDKEYYEAHQSYRVLYQRYKAQGKEKEAFELLYNGTLLLLQHGQLSSGSDLGMLLVDHLKSNKTPVSDELLEKIGCLFGSYTDSSSATSMNSTTFAPGVFKVIPEVDSREGFLRGALKWTNMVADEEQWKYGHPKLHKVAANTYWRESEYAKAREHFLYAEQPNEFGNMLVELATKFGNTGEADLFITQAVLQMLVLKDRKGGLAVFNTYTRKHPQFKTDNPPYLHHPTLNFLWFLLSACKDHSREVFQCLKTNYSPTINRDPSFTEYLDKIGEVWFGAPNQQSRGTGPAPGPSGGIFGGLGATGGLLEGILNSISSVLPQAAGAAVSAAATGGQSSSGTPPTMNFTVPSSTGPTHVHFGTIPNSETAEPPPPRMGAYIGDIPFAFPGFPSNIRFGPPQVNIHFGPPRPSNQAPQRSNQRARAPQQSPTRANNPAQGNVRVRGPLPSGGNIQFGGSPALGGGVRFRPAHPSQIHVLGIRMEGVPIQVPAGGVFGGQGGPIITPEQQQLYQQHTQQTSTRSGGPQNSTSGESQTQQPQNPPPRPDPPTDEDMELD